MRICEDCAGHELVDTPFMAVLRYGRVQLAKKFIATYTGIHNFRYNGPVLRNGETITFEIIDIN